MQCAGLVRVISSTVRGDENANAVERAAIANHLEKARVVVRGGSEPGAAGEALARTVDVVSLAFGTFGGAHEACRRPPLA